MIGVCSGQDKPMQQQAWNYLLQARQGDAVAAENAVTMLEQATTATPGDASLWNLLGRAYFMKISTLGRTGNPAAELVPIAERARDAFGRALERSPNDTNALSGHGMAQTILAGFQRSQEAFTKGIQEMNRAVELDPKANPPRLARAFTMVNFPMPMRSTPSVIEDLSALIQRATYNQRAVDSLHILLGDVYAETGKSEQAKSEYEAAARPASAVREEAQSRLAALQQGPVPAAEIARFRAGLGSRCTMCHAQ
jgi:tetratricopeptide (TPR) repeat protein